MIKVKHCLMSPTTQQPRFEAKIGDTVPIRRGDSRTFVEVVIHDIPPDGNVNVTTLDEGVQITIPITEVEALMLGD